MAARSQGGGDSGFYEPYIRYSVALRSWLIAYGIGVPVLLVSQDLIAKSIMKAGAGKLIAALFLAGVAIQVLAAFLYKYSQEYLYADESGAKLKGTRRLAVAEWLSDSIWFEMLLDVVSLILFVCGTFEVVAVVLAPA